MSQDSFAACWFIRRRAARRWPLLAQQGQNLLVALDYRGVGGWLLGLGFP